MAEHTSVYKVNAMLQAGGGRYRVNSFSIGWGINIVPYANVVIPLSKASVMGHTVVYTGSDLSTVRTGILRSLIDAMDNEEKASFSIYTEKLSGDAEGEGCEINIENWFVSNVKLMQQDRVSPGGIQVTLEHPMCKLKAAPGFFVVDTPKFKELLEDVDGGNIVEVGDSVLDAVAAAMSDPTYTEKYSIVEWQAGLQLDALSNTRLGTYIDANGVGLPFVGLLEGIDNIDKACVQELASHFTNMRGVTPFDVLTTLGNQLGFYVCTEYNQEKAKLKIANPWTDRSGASKATAESVSRVSITPDTDKICGVRIAGSTSDAIICSTLEGKTALKPDEMSGGDTIFYYQTRGRFLDISLPKFVVGMIGRAAVINNTPGESGEASTKDASNELISADDLEDPEVAIKETGMSENDAKEYVDKLKVAWAEANFLRTFRASMQLEVTRPLVDSSFPEIGSFYTCSTGTGGEDVTGLVMSNVVSGSCSSGAITVTTRAAYAGDPPDVDIENQIW